MKNTQLEKRKVKHVDSDQNERLQPITVLASREEIARWNRAAKQDNRKLSGWIRLRLRQMDDRDQELAARAAQRRES